MAHPNHSVPTIHINPGPNAKIYVNTIINTTETSSTLTLADPSKKNAGEAKPRSVYFDPSQGGSLQIFWIPKEGASTHSDNKPIISVDIKKTLSEETSEIKPMTYVITVHKNNVSEEEIVAAVSRAERRAIDHIIGADNVILNSSGELYVGPGAGGTNTAPASGSINTISK